MINVRRTCVHCKDRPASSRGNRNKYCDTCRPLVARLQKRLRSRKARDAL